MFCTNFTINTARHVLSITMNIDQDVKIYLCFCLSVLCEGMNRKFGAKMRILLQGHLILVAQLVKESGRERFSLTLQQLEQFKIIRMDKP